MDWANRIAPGAVVKKRTWPVLIHGVRVADYPQGKTISDGWVPNEHYEAAKVAQMQAYEQLLQAVGSREKAYERERELKALWPFDRK